MSDALAIARAQVRVLELEADLHAAKENDAVTAELKDELRYARWIARGGPAEPDDNRAVAALRARYEAERG